MTPRGMAVRRLCLSALFAALVFLATAYLLHFPTATGYVHLGDSVVYLAACFLPAPYAMAAAGIGAALSDLLSGSPIWMIWTLFIKAAMVIAFSRRSQRLLCRQNAIALVLAAAINLFGYYFAEYFIYGAVGALIDAVPGALFQSGGSTAVFLAVGAAFDRMELKKRIGDL